MEKLANQIGYMVLKSNGAVVDAGGELKDDDRSAKIFMGLLHLTDSIDENFMPKSSCERISIMYEDHSYNICLSNCRIYILKLRNGARNGVASNNGSGGATNTTSSSNQYDADAVGSSNASLA